ncbi:MAG: MBOAT family O-acyltransferase [Evtepia gabavorous]
MPYQALTIRGFWKGWHMTMTRFFTRYLYIPLGGSRRGLPRTCVNTLVIFLASGLWHGADWSFVVWGGLHGIAMVADRLDWAAGRTGSTLHAVLGAGPLGASISAGFSSGPAVSGRRWPCAGPLRGVRSVRWQKSLPPPFRCRRLPGLDATWR